MNIVKSSDIITKWISNKIDVRRSFIFTPGLKPEMFPKAIAIRR